ncbi:MAG: hypothetical protein K2Z81_04145, partial [Cyanobacteria bacterium]|nr:hypothetical protein [Cyanobacteriota bacterium]
RALSSGMVSESTIVHEVASGIADDIKLLVETGEFSNQEGSASEKVSMGSLDKRLGIRTLSLKQLQEVKVNGNIATVTMILHSGKFNSDLDMRGELENKDGYWQASRITNVVDCFQRLFELEGKNKESTD